MNSTYFGNTGKFPTKQPISFVPNCFENRFRRLHSTDNGNLLILKLLKYCNMTELRPICSFFHQNTDSLINVILID